MPAEEQVCVLYAGVKGYLDKIQTSDIGKFEQLYLNHIRTKHGALLDTIRTEEQLTPKTDSDIAAILQEFIPQSGLTLKA
jgi:F0F1-type ATP synthase alpha subunit